MEARSKKLIEANKIFDFVITNKNNFYRNFYESKKFKKKPPFTEDEFRALPLLTKDDLLGSALPNKNFLATKDIRGFSVTSGTTKNKKILMLPFSAPAAVFKERVANKKKLDKLGVGTVIYLSSPLHGMTRHMVYENNNEIPFVLSKVEDFALSTAMIKEGKITGIISTPTIIYQYLPFLDKAGVNNQVKWICLAGEHCSAQKRAEIQRHFPGASIEFVYGSAETGIIGYQCPYLIGKSTNNYHPADNLFLEVVKSDGSSSQDEPGNIVITSLDKSAFPLIRYQNGDVGILSQKPCKCGDPTTLTLLGRSEQDLAKVQGSIIHAEAVERALGRVSIALLPYYYLRINETKINGKILPELTIKLAPKQKLTSPLQTSQLLATQISDNLWLSTKNTLTNLVERGVFLPLVVEFTFEPIDNDLKKTKVIEYNPF